MNSSTSLIHVPRGNNVNYNTIQNENNTQEQKDEVKLYTPVEQFTNEEIAAFCVKNRGDFSPRSKQLYGEYCVTCEVRYDRRIKISEHCQYNVQAFYRRAKTLFKVPECASEAEQCRRAQIIRHKSNNQK